MGLTLVAVLTAALLLPGIVAAGAFYRSAQTREVDALVPTLSSVEGIALVGILSVVVHLIYALGLMALASHPWAGGLPLANPYRLFSAAGGGFVTAEDAFVLFLSLSLMCLIALGVGYAIGALAMKRPDKSRFYGALSEVIAQGRGDDRFITAFVLAKINHGDHVIGYQGTVVSLIRDEDRFPAKVVLKNAAIFYLEFTETGTRRHETQQTIDWIALRADEWHNIAFRVFRIADDDAGDVSDDASG